MPNFVYDDTDLPETKVDGGVLTVPTNQALRAAELNTIDQAIYDVRDAILAGAYHGFGDATGVGVAEANTSRLAHQNGHLSFSDSLEGWRLVGRPSIQVDDPKYGAVGDGVADDTAAIQAAITDAYALSRPLEMGGRGKTYLCETLDFDVAGILYVEGNGAHIKAAPSIVGPQLNIDGSCVKFHRVFLDADREADQCALLTDASESEFLDCEFFGAVIDGAQLVADCDRVKFSRCRTQLCGKAYVTSGYVGSVPSLMKTAVVGTVEVLANVINYVSQTVNFTVGQVVTGGTSGATATIKAIVDDGATGVLYTGAITGSFANDEVLTDPLGGAARTPLAPDPATGTTNSILGTGTTFTGKNIRAGDFISVDAAAPGDESATWLQIDEVHSATFMSCVNHPQVAAMAAGQEYSIHVGDGFHEGPGRADVNLTEYNNCTFINNAGAGIMVHGLYGCVVSNCIFNASGAFPLVLSYVNLATYGVTIIAPYFELNNAYDNFYCGCAFDIVAMAVRCGATALQPYVSSGSFNSGVVLSSLNQNDPGRIDPIGSAGVNWVPSAIITDGAWAKGKMYGTNYAQNAVSTRSYWQIKDSQSAVLLQEIGVENGGADTNAIGRKLNVKNYASGSAAAVAHSANRFLDAVYNNDAIKHALGALGETRKLSTDASGTPGAATIDKPMGCAAFEASVATVTITNALARTDSIIELTMLGDPTASGGVWVSTRSDGSFVVSRNTAPASTLAFMFTVKNPI